MENNWPNADFCMKKLLESIIYKITFINGYWYHWFIFLLKILAHSQWIFFCSVLMITKVKPRIVLSRSSLWIPVTSIPWNLSSCPRYLQLLLDLSLFWDLGAKKRVSSYSNFQYEIICVTECIYWKLVILTCVHALAVAEFI